MTSNCIVPFSQAILPVYLTAYFQVFWHILFSQYTFAFWKGRPPASSLMSTVEVVIPVYVIFENGKLKYSSCNQKKKGLWKRCKNLTLLKSQSIVLKDLSNGNHCGDSCRYDKKKRSIFQNYNSQQYKKWVYFPTNVIEKIIQELCTTVWDIHSSILQGQ